VAGRPWGRGGPGRGPAGGEGGGERLGCCEGGLAELSGRVVLEGGRRRVREMGRERQIPVGGRMCMFVGERQKRSCWGVCPESIVGVRIRSRREVRGKEGGPERGELHVSIELAM